MSCCYTMRTVFIHSSIWCLEFRKSFIYITTHLNLYLYSISIFYKMNFVSSFNVNSLGSCSHNFSCTQVFLYIHKKIHWISFFVLFFLLAPLRWMFSNNNHKTSMLSFFFKYRLYTFSLSYSSIFFFVTECNVITYKGLCYV